MSKNKRKRKKGLLARLYQNSLIISNLNTASAKLHSAVSDSAASRYFCSADKLDDLKNSGMLQNAVSTFGVTQFFSKIKTSFARLVESSNIVSVYRRIVNAILCSCTRDAGIFLLCFGLFSLSSTLLKVFMLDSPDDPSKNLICVAAMLACAIPLLFSKKSIAEKLVKSAAFQTVFSDLLGVSPLALRSKLTPKPHSAIALAVGTLTGTLSFVFEPLDILSALLIAILACMVLYSPESGMLLSLIMMSFVPYAHLEIVLIASTVSYLLKLMRGKRNITLTATDIFVILFSVAAVCSFGLGSIVSCVTLCGIYILIINLFRNLDLLEKGIGALSLGLFINSIVTSAVYVASLLGVDLSVYVPFITAINSSESVLLSLISAPAALLMLHNAKKPSVSILALIFFASSAVNASMSFSLPVWYGYGAVIIIYSMIRLAKPLTTLLGAALTLPFAYLLLAKLSMNRDIVPFEIPGLFSRSEWSVRIFGGGAAEKGDSIFTAIVSSGGIILLALLALTVFFLFTVGFTAINKSRIGSVRLLCGSLIAMLISCLYLFALPSTFGDGRAIVIAFSNAALLSCSGNVFSRLYGTEDY